MPYEKNHAELLPGERAEGVWRNHTGANFLFENAISQQPYGFIGLVSHDETSHVGEAGYWTNCAGSGQGVTTEALQVLTNWSFSALELVRLELWIDADNMASQHVASKSGFHFDALLKNKIFRLGKHRDTTIYSIVK